MLGTYLKNYRMTHNLSQSEMADKLKTSQGYYSLLESNKVKPGHNLIRRLCELFNVEPSVIRSML